MTTMKKQELTLAGVPAILYGERSRKVYLYVHGKNGCKEEAERFANTACAAGWQVLAIDLPEHGARKDRPEQLLPWAVVPEIQAVYARMQPVWPHIRLYGVSIGAWLAMQALRAEKPEKALFVSPVVDMETLILSMMQGATRPSGRLISKLKAWRAFPPNTRFQSERADEPVASTRVVSARIIFSSSGMTALLIEFRPKLSGFLR